MENPKMGIDINWVRLLRQTTSILLLFSIAFQIFIVILLELLEDYVVEFELDEIHEISGFVFLGLILVHTLLYWKSLKVLF